MYRNGIKRGLDVILALIGLILCVIPMGIVALIIRGEDPGPVFFRQRRIGRGKKEFSLIKFRSMKLSTPHDCPTHLLSNTEQYLLKSGRVLRKLSIDELPQLVNILRGEMSFVGPRPALWNQEDLIAARDAVGANAVRPGLTGWAQINGRDELSISEKAKLDGEYVNRISFGFDCRCFFGTFLKALRGDGVVEGIQRK